MAINIKFDELGIFGIIVGVAGAIVAGVVTKKNNDISKKIGKSIDTLDKSTVVQVQQSIIDKATTNAVERQVGGAVKKAIDQVSSQIRSDMDSMIRKDVDCVYNDLKVDVKERVAEEIASLDYDKMREEIKQMAKDKVFDEFCRWGNVGKIFVNNRNGNNLDMNQINNVLDQFLYSSDKMKALNMLLGNHNG